MLPKIVYLRKKKGKMNENVRYYFTTTTTKRENNGGRLNPVTESYYKWKKNTSVSIDTKMPRTFKLHVVVSKL